jgi:hypothetical protein
VAEAIDFCDFYAREAERLFAPRRVDVPGEENATTNLPRGVAVVIAPWNFPLAILCGMTTAALVTGNPVVMKPAEQSSLTGLRLFETLAATGFTGGIDRLRTPKTGESDRRLAGATGQPHVVPSAHAVTTQGTPGHHFADHGDAEIAWAARGVTARQVDTVDRRERPEARREGRQPGLVHLRQCNREKGPARTRAHSREIGKIHRQRFMAQIVGVGTRKKMPTFNQHVGRDC